MPQLKLTTIKKPNETNVQVLERLRQEAEVEKEKIMSQGGAIRMFDGTPAMQILGNEVSCRWKYKQYPLSSADFSAKEE